MLGQSGQEGASDQREVGQEIGRSTAGAVFSEHHVPLPVVANLHAGPVPANQREPLLGAVLLGRRAGQVVVRFGGGLVGFLEAAGVAHHNQAAGKREVRLEGFDGEGAQATGFNASVSGFGEDKKGGAWSASSRWACLNRRFWFSLIWSR